MDLVFERFNVILFAFSLFQLLVCRDVHEIALQLLSFFFEALRKVSSVYNDTSEYSIAAGSSLIYIRNNNGPKMFPCGTPKATGRASDNLFSQRVSAFSD